MQGEELFLDGLVAPYREQALALIRRQVPTIDRFVAVGEYCAAFMSTRLDIPQARISVVPLGISMEGYAPPDSGRPDGAPFRVGYFARVAPEKGLDVLAEAYVRLRRRTGGAPMRLEVAGYLARSNQPYLESVREILAGAGLDREFAYRGEVDRNGKIEFLRGLDVLSVPATYDEPKGLFLLEAMASGVPVVQPRRGGFTEIVERTGGGLLVGRDDPDALADGLHTMFHDPALRSRLAGCAFQGVRAHHTVSQSAARLLDVYTSVLQSRPVNQSVA
jgi:glycosyltransferase involved in cell wall biosynthesis